MSNKLPKFFFAESPESPGAGFILATQRPCYLMKVFKFNKIEEFERFKERNPDSEIIHGYMLAVQYFHTLGESIEFKVDPDDLKVCLKQAADFYLDHRIRVNEKYYKRYSR